MERRPALLVGAGNWGRVWGANLRRSPRVELVGWVDLDAAAAARAARELELDGIYTGSNLAEAIEATRPDFAVNVSVPGAHCDVAIQAMEAGLPVLGEKPMADTMEGARAMVAAADRTGQLLMISQQRRYDGRLQAMRRLIVERIGPLGLLHSDFLRGHRQPDFLRGMDHPLLLDIAIHTFDAARYLSGADPLAVYCRDFNTPWSWYRGHGSATALFEMSGGLRYTYQGSVTSQGRESPWEAEWRAVGPHGTVTWDGASAPRAELVTEIGELPATLTPLVADPLEIPTGLAGSLHDFLDALETGATPMGECHDNIKSLGMVFGAIKSAETGREVPIEL